MKVIDPGHSYLLRSYDGGGPSRLTFVKRCDPPEKYPGNWNAHPGTQIQEVLRALMERCQYINNQIPSEQTEEVEANLANRTTSAKAESSSGTRAGCAILSPLEDVERSVSVCISLRIVPGCPGNAPVPPSTVIPPANSSAC